MAEEAVVEEAGEEVVSHVVVDPGWGQSATAEATAVADRVTPALSPTIQTGRVPYLIAALSVRETGRTAALSARETDRTAALNARVTGKRNKAIDRKPAVSAGKKPLTAGRNGVKITMATI
jgi:hypothetical protein